MLYHYLNQDRHFRADHDKEFCTTPPPMRNDSKPSKAGTATGSKTKERQEQINRGIVVKEKGTNVGLMRFVRERGRLSLILWASCRMLIYVVVMIVASVVVAAHRAQSFKVLLVRVGNSIDAIIVERVSVLYAPIKTPFLVDPAAACGTLWAVNDVLDLQMTVLALFVLHFGCLPRFRQLLNPSCDVHGDIVGIAHA